MLIDICKKFIMILLLLCTSLLNTSIANYSKSNKVEEVTSDIVLITLLPNQDYTLIDTPEAETQAPNSYFVVNDSIIYICDTFGRKVDKYINGIPVNSTPITTDRDVIGIYVDDELIYMLDEGYFITVTDLDGKVIKTIKVEQNKINSSYAESIVYYHPQKVFAQEGDIYVQFQNLVAYRINESGKLTMKYSGHQYSAHIQDDGNCILNNNKSSKGEYFYIAKQRGRTILCTDLKDINGKSFVRTTNKVDLKDGKVMIDDYIIVYKDSKPIKYVNLLPSKYYYMAKDVQINDDGNVYQMVVEKESLRIVKLSYDNNIELEPIVT